MFIICWLGCYHADILVLFCVTMLGFLIKVAAKRDSKTG
jgi:hypothetical protein